MESSADTHQSTSVPSRTTSSRAGLPRRQLRGRSRAGLLATGIALAEGLALLANAVTVAVVTIRDGITGPSAVASPAGVVTEVVVFALFAAGMGAIALGLWWGKETARTPFLLAQVLALTVSIPLLGAEDLAAAVVGVLLTAAAAGGIAAWVTLLARDRTPQ